MYLGKHTSWSERSGDFTNAIGAVKHPAVSTSLLPPKMRISRRRVTFSPRAYALSSFRDSLLLHVTRRKELLLAVYGRQHAAAAHSQLHRELSM